MTRPAIPTPARTLRSFLPLSLALAALSCASGRTPAESPPAEPAPSAVASEPAAPETTDSAAAPETTSTPAAVASSEPADARGKDQIQTVIAANRERVRACYDAAQKNDPGIQGDLVVTFVINPDGSVKSAEVNPQESEIHSPELDTCAIGVLKTLKFPASSRGLESKVNYPFNFKPAPPPPPR